jgi:hypothetical protein
MRYGEHDRACVAQQLHEQKLRIVKKMEAWKTQYETSMAGPLDLNKICAAVVETAIKIVEDA